MSDSDTSLFYRTPVLTTLANDTLALPFAGCVRLSYSFVSMDRQPASACGPISYSSTDVELETKTFWILRNTFWNDIRQLNDKIWAKIFQPASVTCPDSDLSTNSQLPLPHPSNHLFVFSTHLRCAQKKLLINEFSKRCENGKVIWRCQMSGWYEKMLSAAKFWI